MHPHAGGLLALALALAVPSAAIADDPPVRLFAEAGPVIPAKPDVFSRLWQPGVAVGLGLERGIGGAASLVGRLDYARFALDEAAADGEFYTYGPPAGVSGGALTIWGALVGLRARAQAGAVRPYVELAAGVQTIDAADVEVGFIGIDTGRYRTYDIEFSRETKPALAAGAGLFWAVRPTLGVYLDARLDVMFTESDRTHFVPIRAGVLFR